MKNAMLWSLLAAGIGLQTAWAVEGPVAYIESVGNGNVTLSWDAVDGATAYFVYEKAEAYGAATLLVELGAENLSYTTTGTGPFYHVTADLPESNLPGPAPDPTGHDQADVVSVFSDAFTSIPGTDFFPWWAQSTVPSIVDLEGNPTLQYATFNYQGTQLAGPQDVTVMEYLHIDLYTADESAVNAFIISQTTGERPYALPITQNQWNSYDIPLTHWTDQGMVLTDIHQFKFDGGTGGTIYLDNLYFWKQPTAAGSDATLSDLQVDGSTIAGFAANTLNYTLELPYGTTVVPTVDAVTNDPAASYVVNAAGGLPGTTAVVVTAANMTTTLTYNVNFTLATAQPLVAAPTPTAHPDSVLSIYSDAYTNLADSNFNPNWGQATDVFVDYLVGGGNTLFYDELNYQGTYLGTQVDGAPQDVSGYGYFHVDFWTPNATSLRFFLISQTTGERFYELPISLEQWVSVDIPLSHFSDQGLGLTDIFQFKVDGGNGLTTQVYFDNWYFGGTASIEVDPVPTEAAPTPTYGAGSVISLFSNAYTNHPVDTWSAPWDVANLEDVQIAGDDTKHYTNVTFIGVEFTSNPVDATGMTHFRLDFWTPEPTAAPAQFGIKLVDFGANGVWGGGDDTEYTVWITDASVTPLQTGAWVSIDVPLSDFVGLASTEHLAQLIMEGIPSFYLDNVLFHQ